MTTAVSVNLITKDQPFATGCALESLQNFLQEGDEVIVVDTGSSPENLARLEKRLKRLPYHDRVKIKLLQRPDLSVSLGPYIKKWLPEREGQIQKDVQYHDVKGILDFAGARNVALEASTKPLVFWIDSDDVLEEEVPGRLRQIVEKFCGGDDPAYSALFLEYKYAFLKDGTLCTTLKRERIARREWFTWKGYCHETLIPLPGCEKPVGFCEDLKSVIRHTEARKQSNISDIRNYVILRHELESLNDGEYLDPRSLLYLGNACRGLQRWNEAIELYKKFDSQSGSHEDRFAACLYIASIYMHADVRRPVDAHDWYQKASDIQPRDPRAYFGISRCYLARHMYQECIDWFLIGRGFPEPSRSMHSYDPNSVHFHPYVIAAEAYLELDTPQEALPCIQHALQHRPNDEEVRKLYERVTQKAAGSRLTNSLKHIAAHVPNGGPNIRRCIRQIYEHIYAVPDEMEKNGIGRLEAPDPRDEAPRLAIYCGETAEQWGPESAETGIGGSEKMVILLAPALQKLGWNVTVYASVPFNQRGVYPDGVRWQHWSEMDMEQELEVLVAWRGHNHLLLPVSANRRILWLHDVQSPSSYTKPILECLDGVIVESAYHAEPIKDIVPPEKLHILHNAIDDEAVGDISDKDPKRVIFMSSPDRGLVTALKMVQIAQQIDPEIKPVVLYGFSPFERKMRPMWHHRNIPDLGRDACVDDYERYVGAMIDETGAEMRHRVGFDQVWEELRKAGIWLYPTRFPEISCMAAMEAQAAGCYCITSGYAALAETMLDSSIVRSIGEVKDTPEYLKKGAETILKATKVPPAAFARQKLSDHAREKYGIGGLAAKWDTILKGGQVEDCGGLLPRKRERASARPVSSEVSE